MFMIISFIVGVAIGEAFHTPVKNLWLKIKAKIAAAKAKKAA